jgi:hypothetical protein
MPALLRRDDGRAVIAAGAVFPDAHVGYFERIFSERGIAWRCSASLSLRDFLRLESWERVPDHSWAVRRRAGGFLMKSTRGCSAGC